MKKKSKNILMLVILVAIIGISVGYAALSQTLTLDGQANTLKASDWNIHFVRQGDSDEIPYTEVQGVVEAFGFYDVVDSTTPSLTGAFSATLEPGGQVDYTVEVINDGTIDAVLNGTPVVTGGNAEYFTCEVTGVDADAALDAGSTQTFTVSLKAVDVTELPEEAVTAEVQINFNYDQAK